MFSTKKHTFFPAILIIIAVVLTSTLLLYLPIIANLTRLLGFDIPETSLLTIYQNFDGLLYIVPAKTRYVPEAIENLRLEVGLPNEYYAAHLPLYPSFISFFAVVMGYVQSMLFTSILFAVVLGVFFYYFLQKFEITVHPLILTIVFLLLPRFLVVRSVGAPETLFMLLILLSVFFFEKKNMLLAGVFGALAAATKTPGILLFGAYGLVFLEQIIRHKKFRLDWLFTLLIPAGLLGVFAFYAQQYGNFFAYFNTGGVVPMPYPFSAFNFQAKWVETAWLEDIIFYFFLYLFAIIQLKDSKYRSFFYFSIVFFAGAIFVQHRDLSRYMLPLWPFACIAFEKTFTSRKFLLVLLLLLPAIYLYAVNFLLFNVMPVSDWQAFL